MRRFLEWLAWRLPAPRVIRDIAGRDYLSRWYLLPWQGPRMADGSYPYDDMGNIREGATQPQPWFCGVYLHHFHHSDADRELHSHPFAWALSLILAGGYREWRFTDVGRGLAVRSRTLLPGSFNFIRATDFHRVDLIERDCWSLFIVGPKTGGWGFKSLSGEFTPWREFLARKQRAYYEIKPEKWRP